MEIIVPTLAILLNLGTIKSSITLYSDHSIIVHVNPSDTLQQRVDFGSNLYLIDVEKETVTWFSDDLSISYITPILKNLPSTQWEVLLDKKNRELSIIEELTLEDGQNVLKVKLSQEIDSGSCSYFDEQYYLLYDVKLPPNIASLCGIPPHSFELPEEYQHYRSIFTQWIEDQNETGGEINEYATIKTTIVHQPSAQYSVEELRNVPVVSKEKFYSQTSK